MLGIAGLGGYASAIRNEVLGQIKHPDAQMRLAAVCEPDQKTHAALIEELKTAGIAVYRDLGEMLQAPIEAVYLPVPIDLHRPMTVAALAAGKAVLCEKPAAGAVDDLDLMIAARDTANLPAAIGYQDIYEPAIVSIKRQILAGRIGAPRHVTVMACWPRDDAYYNRATWAGRFKRDGVWVMDSPANNALAHYINLPLFLLGESPYEAASPLNVEAELYRAQPIENYDTISMRLALRDGISMLVLLTHTCKERIDPVIEISGDEGTIRVLPWQRIEIATATGIETMQRENTRPHMIQRFAKLVRGEEDDRAVARFETCRPHLVAIGGASQACPVRSIAPRQYTVAALEDGGRVYSINGIEEMFRQCAHEREMIHESGLAEWSAFPGRLDLIDYRHFTGPCSV